jgi:hypothetical protein
VSTSGTCPGGSGGTQSAGGQGGPPNGADGSAGSGGAGASATGEGGAGGGGGGYFGGGGGCAPTQNGDGGGGGGGSGFGPGAAFESGVRPGDGMIVINWTRLGVFKSLNPTRIADTRPSEGTSRNPLNTYNTGPLNPGETRTITVSGFIGPQGSQQLLMQPAANAATFNVAVTDTAADGFLTLYPAGGTKPFTSNINWTAGQTLSNGTTAKLGDIDASHRGINVYNGSAGVVDVILDLNGYFL